ncbi:MAG: hypothetical protein ACE5Q6_11395 [Dehalococcoidia bacterium]
MSSDIYGKFLQCLQCGFIKDIEVAPAFGAKPATSPVSSPESRQPVAA